MRSHLSSKRKLIVSADDFGMSAGVNAGIVEAHRDGVLTNTSLMVNGAAFEEAVALAKEHPSLAVGLHLVLVQGRSTLPQSAIPNLVDGDGYFDNAPILTGMRYYFQSGVRDELQAEIDAQIDKFLSTGLVPSHVDGHLNIHMHPAVLPLLLRTASSRGITAMRVTREALLPALRFDRSHALRKTFEAGAFNALALSMRKQMGKVGMVHPDRIFGLHQTGQVSEDYVLQLFPDLPGGVTEVYCHPAHVDEEAARWRPAEYRGDVELEAMTSAAVRAAVGENDIELISYRELSF